MKEIIVVGVCLLLIGGLIMPAQANNFSLQLREDEEYCPEGGCISDVEVFLEGTFIGKTNETGFFTYEISPSKERIFIERDITLKKEGFREEHVKISETGDLGFYFFGMPLPTPKLTSIPTPAPTAPPLSEGYKTPEQRITELEQQLNTTNTTIQEYETRISWLEGKVNGILNWIRGKFGDII